MGLLWKLRYILHDAGCVFAREGDDGRAGVRPVDKLASDVQKMAAGTPRNNEETQLFSWVCKCRICKHFVEL